MSRTRHSWCLAVLLLALQGAVAGYGLAPLNATPCECSHGPEVACDCPHHGRADTANLPPCHRHLKKAAAPSSGTAGPCVRSHCGSSRLRLLVLPLPQVPGRAAPLTVPTVGMAVLSAGPRLPPETFDVPPRPPPRARS